MTKSEILAKALELNGDDKKYQITVEGDTIITRVKWMDATFFAPDAVTDEVKTFEYAVKIHDNGKYSEVSKISETTKGLSAGGASYTKRGFAGKEITFDKTIGFGKNREDDSVGVINNTFYSEEYKKPVRALLKESGCKKKMGATGKLMIGATIFAVLVIAIAIFAFVIPTLQKEALSPEKFATAAEDFGYTVITDADKEQLPDEFTDGIIALDKEDDYQIDFFVLKDSDYATRYFDLMAREFESLRGNGSKSTTNAPNYQKCTVKTGGSYMCVVRIDNTLLCIDAPKKCADEIKEFIKKIGY